MTAFDLAVLQSASARYESWGTPRKKRAFAVDDAKKINLKNLLLGTCKSCGKRAVAFEIYGSMVCPHCNAAMSWQWQNAELVLSQQSAGPPFVGDKTVENMIDESFTREFPKDRT